MRFQLRVIAGLGSCIAALAHCGRTSNARSCPLSSEPAIVVEIRAQRGGLPLAEVAHGVVRDQDYLDSLRPHERRGTDPSVLVSRAAAFDRPGNYSVEVYVPGYRKWRQVGVLVSQGECGVRTRRLQASLIGV